MNQFHFKNICDECEKTKNDLVICLSCEQTICTPCNNHIHNKGNRLKHPRIPQTQNFYKSPQNKKFTIFFLSFSIYKDYFSKNQKISELICKLTFEKLLKSTKKGKPMILLTNLRKYLIKKMGDSNLLQNKLSECLLLSRKKPLFHKTERNLGENLKIVYFSICLDEISLESLIWVLKSIYRDRMEPNQVLVQSRFKEFFALKIPMKDWNIFVKEINENLELKKKMNFYSEIFGLIDVVKNREDNFIFEIKGLKWVYEDNCVVKDDDEDYKEFLRFVDLFFDEEKKSFLGGFENEKIGLSSVKNSKLRKASTNSQNKLKSLLKTQNIKKAIPGGMYGCVLLLKNLKNEIFDNLSMGRLHALIKKALKKQIIIHYKTLIIKDKKKNPINEKKKNFLIRQAKERILILLKESGSKGITLAQMHNFLIKRFGKKYDFSKLGFPKLKNFLMTIDSVYLDHGDNINHIKAKLRQNSQFEKTKNALDYEKMTNSQIYGKTVNYNKPRNPLKYTKSKNLINYAMNKNTLNYPKTKRSLNCDILKNKPNYKKTRKIPFFCNQSGSHRDDGLLRIKKNDKKRGFVKKPLRWNEEKNDFKSTNDLEEKIRFGKLDEFKTEDFGITNKFETNNKLSKKNKNENTDFSLNYTNSQNSLNKNKISPKKSEISPKTNKNKKKDKTGFQLISGYTTPTHYNQINTISIENLNPFSSLNGRDFPNGFNQYSSIFDLSPQNEKMSFKDDEEEERDQELENMVIKNINSIIDDNN